MTDRHSPLPSRTMGEWIDAVFGTIYPQYCVLCRLRSDTSIALCSPCQRELTPNSHACTRCGLPLPKPEQATSADPEVLCGGCQRSSPPFDRVIAPWLYDELLAYLLHRWKYQNNQRLTALLAHLWLTRIDPLSQPPDIAIPVPLHWQKFLRRGWNQSELLALEMRRQSSFVKQIQLASHWVRRHRATAPQATLNARQRKANMHSAFTVRRRCDNLRVAIIDDVVTTGATAEAMAIALRDAGARSIELWCIARTPEPQD